MLAVVHKETRGFQEKVSYYICVYCLIPPTADIVFSLSYKNMLPVYLQDAF